MYTFTTPKGQYIVGGSSFQVNASREAQEAQEAQELWAQAKAQGETDRMQWARRLAREAREARETHDAQVVLARWRIAQRKNKLP